MRRFLSFIAVGVVGVFSACLGFVIYAAAGGLDGLGSGLRFRVIVTAIGVVALGPPASAWWLLDRFGLMKAPAVVADKMLDL